MARATVVVDLLDQALVMGDLHHAVAAGAVRADDAAAILASSIARRRVSWSRLFMTLTSTPPTNRRSSLTRLCTRLVARMSLRSTHPA